MSTPKLQKLLLNLVKCRKRSRKRIIKKIDGLFYQMFGMKEKRKAKHMNNTTNMTNINLYGTSTNDHTYTISTRSNTYKKNNDTGIMTTTDVYHIYSDRPPFLSEDFFLYTISLTRLLTYINTNLLSSLSNRALFNTYSRLLLFLYDTHPILIMNNVNRRIKRFDWMGIVLVLYRAYVEQTLFLAKEETIGNSSVSGPLYSLEGVGSKHSSKGIGNKKTTAPGHKANAAISDSMGIGSEQVSNGSVSNYIGIGSEHGSMGIGSMTDSNTNCSVYNSKKHDTNKSKENNSTYNLCSSKKSIGTNDSGCNSERGPSDHTMNIVNYTLSRANALNYNTLHALFDSLFHSVHYSKYCHKLLTLYIRMDGINDQIKNQLSVYHKIIGEQNMPVHHIHIGCGNPNISNANAVLYKDTATVSYEGTPTISYKDTNTRTNTDRSDNNSGGISRDTSYYTATDTIINIMDGSINENIVFHTNRLSVSLFVLEQLIRQRSGNLTVMKQCLINIVVKHDHNACIHGLEPNKECHNKNVTSIYNNKDDRGNGSITNCHINDKGISCRPIAGSNKVNNTSTGRKNDIHAHSLCLTDVVCLCSYISSLMSFLHTIPDCTLYRDCLSLLLQYEQVKNRIGSNRALIYELLGRREDIYEQYGDRACNSTEANYYMNIKGACTRNAHTSTYIEYTNTLGVCYYSPGCPFISFHCYNCSLFNILSSLLNAQTLFDTLTHIMTLIEQYQEINDGINKYTNITSHDPLKWWLRLLYYQLNEYIDDITMSNHCINHRGTDTRTNFHMNSSAINCHMDGGVFNCHTGVTNHHINSTRTNCSVDTNSTNTNPMADTVNYKSTNPILYIPHILLVCIATHPLECMMIINISYCLLSKRDSVRLLTHIAANKVINRLCLGKIGHRKNHFNNLYYNLCNNFAKYIKYGYNIFPTIPILNYSYYFFLLYEYNKRDWHIKKGVIQNIIDLISISKRNISRDNTTMGMVYAGSNTHKSRTNTYKSSKTGGLSINHSHDNGIHGVTCSYTTNANNRMFSLIHIIYSTLPSILMNGISSNDRVIKQYCMEMVYRMDWAVIAEIDQFSEQRIKTTSNHITVNDGDAGSDMDNIKGSTSNTDIGRNLTGTSSDMGQLYTTCKSHKNKHSKYKQIHTGTLLGHKLIGIVWNEIVECILNYRGCCMSGGTKSTIYSFNNARDTINSSDECNHHNVNNRPGPLLSITTYSLDCKTVLYKDNSLTEYIPFEQIDKLHTMINELTGSYYYNSLKVYSYDKSRRSRSSTSHHGSKKTGSNDSKKTSKHDDTNTGKYDGTNTGRHDSKKTEKHDGTNKGKYDHIKSGNTSCKKTSNNDNINDGTNKDIMKTLVSISTNDPTIKTPTAIYFAADWYPNLSAMFHKETYMLQVTNPTHSFCTNCFNLVSLRSSINDLLESGNDRLVTRLFLYIIQGLEHPKREIKQKYRMFYEWIEESVIYQIDEVL